MDGLDAAREKQEILKYAEAKVRAQIEWADSREQFWRDLSSRQGDDIFDKERKILAMEREISYLKSEVERLSEIIGG